MGFKIDYENVAKAIMKDYKNGLIEHNEFALLCGYKTAREIGNMTTLKDRMNRELIEKGYKLENIRGMGFRVRQIEADPKGENQKEVNGAKFLEKSTKALEKEQEISKSVQKPTKSVSNTPKSVSNTTESEQNQDKNVLPGLDEFLKAAEKDNLLKGSLSQLLKPFGKKLAVRLTVVDIEEGE